MTTILKNLKIEDASSSAETERTRFFSSASVPPSPPSPSFTDLLHFAATLICTMVGSGLLLMPYCFGQTLAAPPPASTLSESKKGKEMSSVSSFSSDGSSPSSSAWPLRAISLENGGARSRSSYSSSASSASASSVSDLPLIDPATTTDPNIVLCHCIQYHSRDDPSNKTVGLAATKMVDNKAEGVAKNTNTRKITDDRVLSSDAVTPSASSSSPSSFFAKNYALSTALLVLCALLQCFTIHLVVAMSLVGWRAVATGAKKGSSSSTSNKTNTNNNNGKMTAWVDCNRTFQSCVDCNRTFQSCNDEGLSSSATAAAPPSHTPTTAGAAVWRTVGSFREMVVVTSAFRAGLIVRQSSSMTTTKDDEGSDDHRGRGSSNHREHDASHGGDGNGDCHTVIVSSLAPACVYDDNDGNGDNIREDDDDDNPSRDSSSNEQRTEHVSQIDEQKQEAVGKGREEEKERQQSAVVSFFSTDSPSVYGVLVDPTKATSTLARLLDLSVAVSAATCLIVFLQYAVGQLSAIVTLIGTGEADVVQGSGGGGGGNDNSTNSQNSADDVVVGSLSQSDLSLLCLVIVSTVYGLASVPRSYHTLRYTSWSGSLLTAYLLVYAIVLGAGAGAWLDQPSAPQREFSSVVGGQSFGNLSAEAEAKAKSSHQALRQASSLSHERGEVVVNSLASVNAATFFTGTNSNNGAGNSSTNTLIAVYVFPPSAAAAESSKTNSSSGNTKGDKTTDEDESTTSFWWSRAKTAFVLIGIYVSLFSCQYTIPILIREYQTKAAKRRKGEEKATTACHQQGTHQDDGGAESHSTALASTDLNSKAFLSSSSSSLLMTKNPAKAYTVAAAAAITLAFAVYLSVGAAGNTATTVLENRLKQQTCDVVCQGRGDLFVVKGVAANNHETQRALTSSSSASDSTLIPLHPTPQQTEPQRKFLDQCKVGGDYVSCIALMVHFQISSASSSSTTTTTSTSTPQNELLSSTSASSSSPSRSSKAPVAFLVILRIMLLLHFLGAFPLFAVTARKALLSGLLGRSEDDTEKRAREEEEERRKDANRSYETTQDRREERQQNGEKSDDAVECQNDGDVTVPLLPNTSKGEEGQEEGKCNKGFCCFAVSIGGIRRLCHSRLFFLFLRRVLITLGITALSSAITFLNPNKMSDVFALNGALFANATTIVLPAWLFVRAFYAIVGGNESGCSGKSEDRQNSFTPSRTEEGNNSLTIDQDVAGGSRSVAARANGGTARRRWESGAAVRFGGGWVAIVAGIVLTAMAVLSWVLQHV